MLALASVRDRLDDAAARLAGAGIETPRVDAEWLLAAALGVGRGRLRAAADQSIGEEAAERYEGWVQRRVGREPLQHVLGTQAFRDLTVRVGPDVLVPRPETELLVSWALDLLPAPGGRPLVLDVGTGSGCIACALASERPDVRVVAVDVSPAAVAVARRNVVELGLADRVTVSVSDLFSGLAPLHADLVISNPPYLPTSAMGTLAPEITGYEPRAALDGGPDGLDVIGRILTEAPHWLRGGAAIVLETAGGHQADEVMAMMGDRGLIDLATRRDLAGVTRFVSGRLPNAGRRKGGEAPRRG